ncbi:CPBP family glutamic-type intramembrane protease [Aquimarina sp. 2201CG14-23]|uniref:CPBP family glutamic-type intramembrane protease n=1 Tax=Aquimarina mycalae TaxID=3040073 RepID=UPI00247810B3|nr:CPBP family glutamic-type intramembrane protease [Aquimarina sp. 2201CG14-23]MDH7448311.1 CPBP family glutamic-type intramembrane protease [Aquimarina sp. 2201CG14-23]
MKKTLNEVIEVLKTGEVKRTKYAVKEYILIFLKIIVLVALFRFMAMMLSGLILHFLGIEIPENLTQTSLEEKTFLGRMFLALILAPVIEECATRLGLVFSIRNFVISTSLLLFFILHFVINKIVIFDAIHPISINQRILVSGIYGVLMFVLLIRKDKITKTLSNFWSKHKRSVFYLSFLFFGYMHIFNFELTLQNILISPILLSSHFVMGIFLGYARLKLGMFSAISLHTLNNTVSYIKYLF